MFAPKPPLAPEGWAKDVDTSKVQNATSTNFFLYCGLGGIVFFVLFFIWVLVPSPSPPTPHPATSRASRVRSFGRSPRA